jgi:hypothetical protein
MHVVFARSSALDVTCGCIHTSATLRHHSSAAAVSTNADHVMISEGCGGMDVTGWYPLLNCGQLFLVRARAGRADVRKYSVWIKPIVIVTAQRHHCCSGFFIADALLYLHKNCLNNALLSPDVRAGRFFASSVGFCLGPGFLLQFVGPSGPRATVRRQEGPKTK